MLGVLAHIRLRPGMWIGSKDEYAIRAFVTGLSLATDLLGIDIIKTSGDIWLERGWKIEGSMDHIHLLKEAGLSPDEVALETFTALILNIQRQYNLTSEKVLDTHRQMRENITENKHEISDELAHQMESLEKDLVLNRNS